MNKFSILNRVRHFSSRIFQNYFLFIPAIKQIKYFYDLTQIYLWKCNGLSEESIENITEWDSNFAPTFVYHHSLPEINFNEHYLMKYNISFPRRVINLYISYTLCPQLTNCNTYFTLSNCLFGSVKLTKITELDKYKYTGYGIEFDSHEEFSLTEGSVGKNVIICYCFISWYELMCILIIIEKIF